MITEALRYANIGWNVIPLHYPIFADDGVKCSCGRKECKHQGKHPIQSKWTEAATADEDQIREWWGKKPDANIGIACGPGSGIFLLDIDGDKSMERMRTFAREHDANADADLNTVKSKTSKGFHLVFKWENRLTKLKNWTKLSDDLDIRSDGGQFVAPPSVHKSGVRYTWVKSPWDEEPKNVPAWLIDFLEAEQIRKRQEKLEKKREAAQKRKYQVGKYVDAAIEDELRILRSATEGERNTQLNESAIKLYGLVKGGYLDRGDVERELAREARRLGLKERETRATMDSAWNGAEARVVETYKEISQEELDKIKPTEGPTFINKLPKDHFLTRVIAYGHDISDAYADYWYAGGLYALAVASDKKLMINLRQGTLYPSLYVFIAGKSTLTHKSTAIKKIEELLVSTRRDFIESKAPTEFSPEAFIEHMHHYNHSHWIRDEASELLGMMQKDYMKGFKGSLMQLYDCSPIHRMLRSRNGRDNTFKVTDPFLNIIWTATDSGLAKNTSANDTLSGFMARFLWHFPNRPKDHWLPLEEGDKTLSVMEDVVANQLSNIVSEIERMEPTPMHMSKEAAVYFTEWQRVRENHWIETDDEHAMQIYGRLAPTVLKLAILFELGSPGFDPARPIRLDFIREACRQIDEYYMPTARRIYESVGADAEKNVIDRIVRVLKSKGGKATARTISRTVKIKKKELDEYIETMVENGMVELFENREGGTDGRRALWIVLLSQEDDIETNNKLSNVSIVTTVSNVTNVTDPNVCVLDKRQKRQKDISDISKKPDVGERCDENFKVTVDENDPPNVTALLGACEQKEMIIEEVEVAERYGMTVGELRTVLDDRKWTMLRGGRWKPPSRTG